MKYFVLARKVLFIVVLMVVMKEAFAIPDNLEFWRIVAGFIALGAAFGTVEDCFNLLDDDEG